MATLTETAYQTRKAINWAILAVISYIILRILWSIFLSIWLVIFPPKAAPPNHAFGKLPTLQFPAPSSTPSGTLTFQLETIEGTVPKASESAMVFFMPKYASNLLALSKATEFAKRLEFTNEPIQETKYIYRFEDQTAPLRKLRYDIVSKNFILRYLYEKDMSVFTERNIPLEDAAKLEAKSYLQTYGLYEDDIAAGTSIVTFLKLSGDALVRTTSFSQADSVRVDFFRAPIVGTQIVTPYPGEAPISFVFSGSKDAKKRVLQFAYTYWPIDHQTTGTYPLKASSLAWTELQNGQGYIATYPKTGTTAVIRKVYLAYYDSIESQTYLQPVFVFEGDNDFLAYVPAVESTWIESGK